MHETLIEINIRAFNFCGWPPARKYFNNENFTNYGIPLCIPFCLLYASC